MATITVPQGTPIPFTVSMPTGTGLTAANFDECDDVFAYLCAQRYLSFTAGTNGYAQCSQIVVKLEHVNSGEVAKEWRKVAPGFGRWIS